jgi:cobalt-zinc-cadmium efflux system membrane fusion protein
MRWPFVGVPLLSVLFLASCSHPAAQVEERQVPPPAADDGIVTIKETSQPYIGVETVGSAKSESMIAAPAHVEFKEGAVSQLGAPLDGRIVAVHAKIGDRVKKGDPLVTLDCPDAAEIRAQVETARASLREARAALDRQERMLTSGVGTEKEHITAETHLQETEAELARVEADAAFVGMGTGTGVVLRSPITGTVITRKANVGLAVQKGGDPIIEIGDPSAVWLVADVFERDLARVHEGAHAQVDLPSLEKPVDARVTSIGTVVATGLRTAPVRIAIDAAATQLHPGMYGSVQIQAFDGDITIPTQAVLIKDGRESVVWVQKDALTFERRRVNVAQHVGDGTRVQITSGLAPGDKVVVKGALLLDGSAEQLL